MTAVARTKSVLSLSSKPKAPVTIGKIEGPIRVYPIPSHGKPATIIPASIARYYGFQHNWDWLAFDASIVEGGILLTIKNRFAEQDNDKEIQGAGSGLSPRSTEARSNGELQLANATSSALTITGVRA